MLGGVQKSSYSGTISAILFVACALSLGGCKDKNRVIDKIVTKVSDNLEVVRVTVVFNSRIQTNFSGGVALKNYGYLFVNPPVQSKPLEAGFELNTSIVNEQDYLHLEPTMVLPNDYPLGVPNPVVQIQSENPVSPDFDLYGYVDVSGKSWLGVATMLKAVNEYFPDGLAFTQVFLTDKNGKPAVLGHAFGPTRDAAGQIKTHGGIAVLANVRYLIQQKIEKNLTSSQSQTLRPIPMK